jgi:hypothetical protein
MQIVLCQFVIKQIQIHYIQIRYTQFCVNLDTFGYKFVFKIQIVLYQFVCKQPPFFFLSLKKMVPLDPQVCMNLLNQY